MRVRRDVIASVKGLVHLNFCLIVLSMKRPTDPSLPLKVNLVLTRLGQRGVVSRTAGLLFSSARGFFGGLHNPWKQAKPSTVHSEPNISVRSELSQASKSSPRPDNPGLSRAKSLELVPEYINSKTCTTTTSSTDPFFRVWRDVEAPTRLLLP